MRIIKLVSLKTLLVSILFMSVFSCQKEEKNKPDTPIQEPNEVPTNISECLPEDVNALRELSKQNLNLKLFQGDNPKEWKDIEIKWKKNPEGKFVVSQLVIKEGVKSELNLDLDVAKVKLTFLEKLVIASEHLKTFKLVNQPALKFVEIDGKSKASISSLDIQGQEVIKEIKLSALPEVASVFIGGDELDKLELSDFPKLVEQNNFKFRPLDVANNIKDTHIKEVILGGIINIDGLYLFDLALEKISLAKEVLPLVETITLNKNKLKETLEFSGYAKLNMVNLANNDLKSVNISDCPELTELDASSNKDLKSVVLNKVDNLKVLTLNETAISEFNTSAYTNLKSFSAVHANLSTVTLSDKNAEKLSRLNLSGNKLTELVFPSASWNLVLLTLNDNKLSSLDITQMAKLERLLINSNELQNLLVSASIDQLECKNNHLSVKVLKQVREKLVSLSSWEIAPQTVLNRVNQDAKTVDAKEEINLGLSLMVQKFDADKWNDITANPNDDFSIEDDIYTFKKAGKYRVICTSFLDPSDWKFETFTLKQPYIIGALEF